YYQQQLQQHPDSPSVKDYLAQRGISQQTIADFAIGYAPDGWDNILKRLSPNNNKPLREQLVELRLINRSDSGREYDFFRQRLMFPIRDRRGRVIAFGGRILGDGTPKYLNSPETRLFH